ncbi:MAG TPA: lactate utilization protein C [Solirubrobacter sp.]|nr:lactate utilization protein C [Solirubrobacter sp.]
MTDPKTEILTRIRAALRPAPAVPAIPRAYHRAGTQPTTGAIDRFCERAAEYRATVHRTTPAGLTTTIAAALGDAARVGVPAGFPPLGREVVEDEQLSVEQLDRLDAVVTGSALAIAETGTIILDGGPRSGRRALTLVPDHHVCIVDAAAIVPAVPDAIARLARDGRPLTFVSGPSATSDIELDRVEGVHGPRRLDIVVVS